MDIVFGSIVVEIWLVALIVGVVAMFGYEVGKTARPTKRKWQRPKNLEPTPSRPRWDATSAQGPQAAKSGDAADQLRAVCGADFRTKRVLSITEARVLAAAEAAINEMQLGWRVMAQVALGEVLSSTDDSAFKAINAKRVDLLVVSAECHPLAAIEYQGSGHYLGSDAAARDAVKKEALRRAKVDYIEIGEGDGPADVRRAISRLAASRAGGTQSTKRLAA